MNNSRYSSSIVDGLIVEGDRFMPSAIERKDCFATKSRDISSRSGRHKANRDLLRAAGRIPPNCAKCGKIEEDARLKCRPIKLIAPPRCHPLPAGDTCIAERDSTSRISACPSNLFVRVKCSRPALHLSHSDSSKRLKCCAHPLKPHR